LVPFVAFLIKLNHGNSQTINYQFYVKSQLIETFYNVLCKHVLGKVLGFVEAAIKSQSMDFGSVSNSL
jgi:hypothetical protein